MAWSIPATGFLNVYASGYGVGPGTGLNREDLSDLILNLDPWDNLVYASAPKVQAFSTTHEWAYDTLPVASRAGVPEGSEFSPNTLTTPVRTSNFTQLFRFDVGVTGTATALNLAGIGDVYNYHVLNGTHAIAKAVEQRIFDQSTLADYPGAGTASSSGTQVRLFKELAAMMDATMIVDAGLATITADMVDQAMEQAYAVGTRPEMLCVSQGVKADLSRNVAASVAVGGTRNVAQIDKRIVRSVDIYEGDFGALSIVPNRSIPQATGAQAWGWAWLIERSRIGIATLRPIKHTPLAKTGDNTKGMVVGELTLELRHPKGIAAIKRVIT